MTVARREGELMKNHHLFTIQNPKTMKSEALGYTTLVLHLAPHTLNGLGVDLCPFSTPQCVGYCLNSTGRGKFSYTQEARKRKAKEFLNDREAFTMKLLEEILWYKQRAKNKICVRLNGTSDIRWDNTKVNGHNLFHWLSDIQFYDYTKNPSLLEASRHYQNYDVTFSHSEGNGAKCLEVLQDGYRVASIYPVKGVRPGTYAGYPCVDGDQHDLRFLDPEPCVVWLKPKGKYRKVMVNV